MRSSLPDQEKSFASLSTQNRAAALAKPHTSHAPEKSSQKQRTD